jgi:hypothetical protein
MFRTVAHNYPIPNDNRIYSAALTKKWSNHRSFLDTIAPSLGVRNPQDWLHVTNKQVREAGGSFVLNAHKISLIKGNI